MRELLFKNMLSRVSNKREIVIEEVINSKGYTSKTSKKSQYFVKGVRHFADRSELNSFLMSEMEGVSDKEFHIMRKHSDSERSNIVLCKSKGSCNVVRGNTVTQIVYLHVIRFEIAKSAVEEKAV